MKWLEIPGYFQFFTHVDLLIVGYISSFGSIINRRTGNVS